MPPSPKPDQAIPIPAPDIVRPPGPVEEPQPDIAPELPPPRPDVVTPPAPDVIEPQRPQELTAEGQTA
jgi:hypothetical protein